VKAAVKAGLGISLVFASAVENEVRAGSLRALPITGMKIQKELYVILPEDTSPLSPSHSFAQVLLS
jgi:DNA-binding transcriptional LysR family regulator